MSAKVAVVSSSYATQNSLKVGSTIKVAGKSVKVIGIASVSSGAADVYLPLATAQKLAGMSGKITTRNLGSLMSGRCGHDADKNRRMLAHV